MKPETIFKIVLGVLLVAGVVAFTNWLLLWQRSIPPYDIIPLDGGYGDAPQRSAFTRIREGANLFWWFYPSAADGAAGVGRPVLLWLGGGLELPASSYANLRMFGPYDVNMNLREDSWVSEYNLLFVDAPVGSGFSYASPESFLAKTEDETVSDLVNVVRSFVDTEGDYVNAAMYVAGEGYGARLAALLALELHRAIQNNEVDCNLQGVILGNAVISPALAMTRLGFYLEELGYVDADGRAYVETLSEEVNQLVTEENFEAAFELWANLEDLVSEGAGAISVNINHLVEKMTQNVSQGESEINIFMDATVAPALGVASQVAYDSQRPLAVQAVKADIMKPAVTTIEALLQESDLTVTIYNGNMDAVSNTPGQLLWVNSLEWSGSANFTASPRNLVVVDGQLEGYVRRFDRLSFFWMNAAGKSVPVDSPVAMRELLRLTAGY